MALTVAQLYRFHCENLREVERGRDQLARMTRSALSRKDRVAATTLTKSYCLLIGVWADVRLLKVLHEPNAFPDAERRRLSKDIPLVDRYKKAAEFAFRKALRVPNGPLRPPVITKSDSDRFAALIDLLDDPLSSVLTIRNKLAHGQWVYPLNSAVDNVNGDLKRAIDSETLHGALIKASMVEGICRIVNDLVVSTPTFRRDFDMHYNTLSNAQLRLTTQSSAEYVDRLIAQRERGLSKAAQNWSLANLNDATVV